MTTEERTELFKIYLQKFVQREQTVSGYISSLNNDFPIKLNMNNLFTNTNLIELKNISDNCNNDLEDWSKSIGNHRPRAAINKYISFLQYQDILKVLDKYDINHEKFELNGAYSLFKIKDRIGEYPIVAICREILEELDLSKNFTTNQAKTKLKQIIPKNILNFVDFKVDRAAENNAKAIIRSFILSKLKRNEDDIYDSNKFIELRTLNGNSFIIYKKNTESSIFVKPKEGQSNFSEAIKKIVDYKVYNRSSHGTDASYIIPITEEIFKEFNKDKEKSKMNIKNIILYGAPGVGKTHNYKNMISQIEQGNSQKEIFDSFQNVRDEKRVEFITFHQSFSYEDFIEGFRPQESGNLEIEDGIFKLISKNAKNQVLQKETKTISFDDAYDMLREKYFENALDKIYSISEVEIFIHEFKENTLKVQSSNAKDNQYVKKSDLETVVNSFMKDEIIKPSDIKKLDVKKDTISLAGLYFPFGELISQIMKENKISEEKEKNFYLVIDEINRGNISKIFGELITLIEESKRDKYEVTLPYSKQKFSIPSNLYIIGTMNTTDKSIALIDVALRRRFTFIKMKPNEDLVLKSFQDKFIRLNEMITKHIGEDYQIGHSYFMNIQEDDLSFVLDYKIKPLLEEYYYGDDRLNEVLDILGIN